MTNYKIPTTWWGHNCKEEYDKVMAREDKPKEQTQTAQTTKTSNVDDGSMMSKLEKIALNIKSNIRNRWLPFAEGEYGKAQSFAGNSNDKNVIDKLNEMKYNILGGYESAVKSNVSNRWLPFAEGEYEKAKNFAGNDSDPKVKVILKRMEGLIK